MANNIIKKINHVIKLKMPISEIKRKNQYIWDILKKKENTCDSVLGFIIKIEKINKISDPIINKLQFKSDIIYVVNFIAVIISVNENDKLEGMITVNECNCLCSIMNDITGKNYPIRIMIINPFSDNFVGKKILFVIKKIKHNIENNCLDAIAEQI
jgi:hypothetical protein